MPEEYELLPTADGDKARERLAKRLLHDRIKKILFRVLAAFAVMYFAIQGIRAFAKSSAQFLHGPGCHGGMHRNLSSLPSQYTLPSGNQIPSVALGTVNTSCSMDRQY